MDWKRKRFFFIDLLIAALGFALDQYTKSLAVAHLKGKEPISLIPGILELRYLENRGAAFGMLQGGKIFFIIMTCIILIVVLYVIWKMPLDSKYRKLHLMCAFLTAGALGNFSDRLRLDYVVDFIYISIIDFPIFNVADMFVSFVCVIGILLVFFGHYREDDFSFLKLSKNKK